MGLLFESLCVRDLRVYAQSLDGTLYHYRDKSNLECDAVIHLRDGSYALVEVKLGGAQIDTAATNLKKLANKIDPSQMKRPTFMMILTAGQYAYRRDDGICVIPLASLGP
jgi:predicted AAA+ superfamily ATPase